MLFENVSEIAEKSMSGFSKAFCDHPKLVDMYKKNFVLFTDKYLVKLPDDSYYALVASAISAMWGRDSSTSVTHLIPFASDDPKLAEIIKGISATQMKNIRIDPYSNSIKKIPDASAGWHDKYYACPWTWERKYELDNISYPFRMAYLYYKSTGDDSIFNWDFKRTLMVYLEHLRREQHHTERSVYRFERENCPKTDTISNGGFGAPVAYTGMVWSGFRPSDDACKYGYLIPSNMLASVVLGYMAEISETVYKDVPLTAFILEIKQQIDSGIEKYGIVEHEKYGKIYAYEVDGYGNSNIMDDATIPSLLSIPYIGYVQADNPIYLNTRRFILSKDNPFWFEGKVANGVGSEHVPTNNAWFMSVVMQAMTSTDISEIESVFDTLELVDNGTGYMRESFNVDDPTQYTWEDFCWASALFCELMYRYANHTLPCNQKR